MSQPFIGEIRIMAFNFPPRFWAMCNGQLLPINQNQALFALLGTQYGGNGTTNFALPNLQGRVPIEQGTLAGGNFYPIGQVAGELSHTLSATEMPAHTHSVLGSSDTGSGIVPAANVVASASGLYGAAASLTGLNPASVGNSGGSQAHENRQPFLVLNFCIALQGIFPSRN
jgi:microcystin-dependent protein